MKVFISWSGDRSRAIADVLRRWLPSVLQAVRPYFSPDDVAKGSRWSAEIAKELDASRIGLLVITPENQEAPWLLFEAGALAKNLDRSKVCPLLFGGMEPTDVKGPLVQFQAAQFSKEELKRVMKMINSELGDAALTADVLDSVFEMWWPRLQEEVNAELEAGDDAEGDARRPERDLLEEVLALTRGLSRDRERRHEFEHPVWDDLLRQVSILARVAKRRLNDDETNSALKALVEPVEYIARRSARSGGLRSSKRARHLYMELRDMLEPEVAEPSEEVPPDALPL